ncbi:hypothetical protein GCM10009619_27000 [Williamsia maris]
MSTFIDDKYSNEVRTKAQRGVMTAHRGATPAQRGRTTAQRAAAGARSGKRYSSRMDSLMFMRAARAAGRKAPTKQSPNATTT